MVAMRCALLISLMWASAQAAEPDKTRSVPTLQPISVSGNPGAQRLVIKRLSAKPSNDKVGTAGTGFFCGSQRDVRFTEDLGKAVLRDFIATAQREFQAAGYPKAADSLFGNTAESDAPEYEIGATLTDVELNLCTSGTDLDGGLWVRVRWELYAPRERRVTFTTSTEGSALVKASEKKLLLDLTRQAVTNATRNLLADAAFVENATRKAQAAAATQQPALPLAKRATSTQAVGDNITLLQSAVVTLFNGVGSGSGFFINRDGWLLTNQHVVGDAKFVKVKLASGRELVGEVMRSSAPRDVALVKTEAVALAPFELSTTEGQTGEDVYVLGSPLGDKLAYTVTRGVLSATREVQRLRWLQSDVRVLPGSSGGPMVGRTGAVIGITSRGLGDGGAGINFFVPIADALAVLKLEFQDN
jgi:serine protease Do